MREDIILDPFFWVGDNGCIRLTEITENGLGIDANSDL